MPRRRLSFVDEFRSRMHTRRFHRLSIFKIVNTHVGPSRQARMSPIIISMWITEGRPIRTRSLLCVSSRFHSGVCGRVSGGPAVYHSGKHGGCHLIYKLSWPVRHGCSHTRAMAVWPTQLPDLTNCMARTRDVDCQTPRRGLECMGPSRKGLDDPARRKVEDGTARLY